MKLKITELEASADELRANRTLGEIMVDALKNCLSPVGPSMPLEDEQEDEE